MLSVLRKVFSDIRYSILAVFVMILVLSFSLLLPNTAAITQVFSSESISLVQKTSFVLSLYGSISTNFSVFSAANLLLISVLFGVNITLLVYYIKQRQTKGKTMTAHFTSLAGMVSGLLGIGCAACGSVVLTAIIGTAGVSTILVWLPFNGVEFGVLGVAMLTFSITYLLKKITAPLICEQ